MRAELSRRSDSDSPPSSTTAPVVAVTRESLDAVAPDVRSAFGATAWPTIALGWVESWRQSCPEKIEVEALVARREGRVVGVAYVYRVVRLELLRYLGGLFTAINEWLRAHWHDPVTLRIAYVDLPYTDEEAVFVVPAEPAHDAVREGPN